MKFLQLRRGILLNFDCVSLEQKLISAKCKIPESSPSWQAGSSMLDQQVTGFDPPESLVDTACLLKQLMGHR